MKLDELKAIKPTDKFPPRHMTNAQWQQYFKLLRTYVQPSSEKNIKNASPAAHADYYGLTYNGETQWYYYRQFINTILSAIRQGDYDYCYYIFQIADLLKFEHDNLIVEWLPEDKCFRVSLKSIT